MDKIKNGQPLASTDGATPPAAAPEKSKATPRKRKSKVADASANANGEESAAEGSPKKRATPRARKKKAEVVENESLVDEEMV